MSWELVKDSKQCRCWLNLDEMGIITEGVNKGRKNWKNSINKKIGIRYQWMNDEVEEKWFVIKEYKNRYLTLVDENEDEFQISTGNLRYGQLGKIFDKKIDKFRYNIDDTVNDLVIINREYRKNKNNQNRKYYQYKCKKCGNVDWMTEYSLKKGHCNVCTGKKVLKGINDIATTNPGLIKYFINQEDIYTYTAHSAKRVLLQCPDCKFQKEMRVRSITNQGFACPKCSDGISYPEKFTINVLIQLNIKIKTQYRIKGYDNYFYDFYLSDNIIIETHGSQHYKDTTGNIFKTYKETHENDMIKYDIAVLNGFEVNKNYFVIDSRESTLDWMKKNITKTLGHIFDFSNVDWEKADIESQKSHMLLACKFKKENQDLTSKEVIKLIKEETGIEHSNVTIVNWLNYGNKLGLCYYDGKEERIKRGKRWKGKPKSEEHRQKISEANKGKPKSEEHRQKISEANRSYQLINRFDKQGQLIDTKYKYEYVQMGFLSSNISRCCKGRIKSTGGYVFKYHNE